jgi:hypothetical protein
MTGYLADETNRRPLSDGRRIEMSASGRKQPFGLDLNGFRFLPSWGPASDPEQAFVVELQLASHSQGSNSRAGTGDRADLLRAVSCDPGLRHRSLPV